MPPVSAWEQVANAIIELLIEREISPIEAESWLWYLIEFAERTA
jgi:hypothetical protein